MAVSRRSRWLMGLALSLLFLTLVAVVGAQFATRALKSKVETVLGANGEIGEIRLGLTSVEIVNLRIKAASGWPVPDELRAKRIVIRPDLRALLSSHFRLSSISVEDAYISLLRRKDGKLLILPSLLDKASDQPDAKSYSVQVGAVTLSGGAVDFFDATVRKPAHQTRLEQVAARLGKISIPDLTGRTDIDVEAVVKGVRHDGKLTIKGDAEFASRDSEISARLRGVDLVAFQPYLIKAAESGVRRGTLDLEIKSTVRAHRLRAPGTLTLSGLELSSSGGFMGLPRTTVLSMMKDKNGVISTQFVLEGDINDPSFSLNENFSGRVASSLAGVMGVSLGGLAKDVGTAGGSVIKGVGDTVGKIFGRK
ncbi:MAG: hypothetical protein BWY57_00656 [Betaproteobacteria bacterium ADurb.Bin341]|nr:MAG: hypothetical protein BWY57_00656 [Betaproteobacteria bacterium ADurb.Bin341]